MPGVLRRFLPGEKDAVPRRPISLLFHREKITHESDVQILHLRYFLSRLLFGLKSESLHVNLYIKMLQIAVGKTCGRQPAKYFDIAQTPSPLE